jgi:polyhydroxybutyrate depolymerase
MLTILLLSLITLVPPPAATPDAQAPAAGKAPAAAPVAKHLEWTIDGVKREAVIYIPPTATTSSTPIIFAFHGHGGTARHAANTFEYQKLWPEAISVYMQGLPTAGALTDPKGERNGWQKHSGDQNDRDLKFFDEVLATLRKDYKVDDARIYAAGHSNGGGFTYLLWAKRAGILAAVAPSSAGPGSIRDALALTPKPCMHIGGEKDPLVKFANQQRTMERDRRVNQCEDTPQEWGPHALLYPSKIGTPFVSVIHSGGHEFYTPALPLIVKFFKEHPKPAASPAPPTPDAPKPASP